MEPRGVEKVRLVSLETGEVIFDSIDTFSIEPEEQTNSIERQEKLINELRNSTFEGTFEMDYAQSLIFYDMLGIKLKWYQKSYLRLYLIIRKIKKKVK